MTEPSMESYIITEGYHDRAFWAGLLTYLGCTDPGAKGSVIRVPVQDPWGLRVEGGQYAYRSRTDQFVRIVPAKGKANIRPLLKRRLEERLQKPLRDVVVNPDSDKNADGNPSGCTELTYAGVEPLVRSVDPSVTRAADGTIQMDQGSLTSLTIHVILWHALDPPSAGIPNQNTLERIICAAIVAAYPERAQPVHRWLESRPNAPSPDPKEHAWSYLAGWYASSGSYDGFCQRIWQDPEIAAQLKSRLEAAGIWKVAEALAN